MKLKYICLGMQAHGKVMERNKDDKCRNADEVSLAGGEGTLRSRGTQALTAKVAENVFLNWG